MQKIFLALFILLACGQSNVAQSISPDEISTDRIKQTIEYLASDNLSGRLTGSKGEEKSYQFIISKYKKLKLTPAGDHAIFAGIFIYSRKKIRRKK